MVLKLFEQRWRATFVDCCAAGQEKEILIFSGSQLGLPTALQQLLKFGTQSPKACFKAWHGEEPVRTQGCIRRCRVLTLPEVGTRGEEIKLDVANGRQGLEQLHLHRRQAAQTEKA